MQSALAVINEIATLPPRTDVQDDVAFATGNLLTCFNA